MRPRNFWVGKIFPGGKTSKEPCCRGRAGKLWKCRLKTIDCCHHLSVEWKPEHFFTAGNYIYNFHLVFHLIENGSMDSRDYNYYYNLNSFNQLQANPTNPNQAYHHYWPGGFIPPIAATERSPSPSTSSEGNERFRVLINKKKFR